MFENHIFPSITRPDMGGLFTHRVTDLFLILIIYAGTTDTAYITLTIIMIQIHSG